MNKKLFILSVFLILIYGFYNSINSPKDKLSLENRSAVKLQQPTVDDFLHRGLQKNFEDGLTDQLPFAEESKRTYNYVASYLGGKLFESLSSEKNMGYIKYNNLLLYDDYIVYPTRNMDKTLPILRDNIENVSYLISTYPQLNFFVYYIEKDTDIYFDSGEKLGIMEYLYSNLNLSQDHMGAFIIDSFADYEKYFYKTDHHWNNIGSFKGYKDLVKLMDLKNPVTIKDEYTFVDALSGSKALETGTTDYKKEDFKVYIYDLPPLEVKVNGSSVLEYGGEVVLANRNVDKISYGDYYGGDFGETVFNTGNIMNKSVLVIGDSYDNAILNPLASHFYKTYAIDLRYYELENGIPFDFDSYVKNNYIDTVLFIGNIDFYTLDDFIIH